MSQLKRLGLAAGVAALLAGLFLYAALRSHPVALPHPAAPEPVDLLEEDVRDLQARRLLRAQEIHRRLYTGEICPDEADALQGELSREFREEMRTIHEKHGKPLPGWLDD